MQKQQERKLVAEAVDGDIESFGELCGHYYSPMVAIAYSFVADHQMAEDAAQESFIRAFINLRKLKDKTRFAPWLAGICRNVAKDMTAARAKSASAKGLTQTAARNDPDENSALIRRAIEQLPAPARELIVLRYYDNLSYERLALVLGVSRAAVHGRLIRAKRRMAKILKQNGFPEIEP